MMNLKIFRTINIKSFTLTLLFLIFSNNVLTIENKIIFKVNNYAFTSYDYEMRVRYLDFIGGDKYADREIITKDLISAYIFFEYYKNVELKKKYEIEINNIYERILKENIKSNKKYEFEVDRENILFNIKIDLIRKNILESLLNERVKKMKISNQEIDLLYIFNIKYINFESEINFKIKKEIDNLDEKNISSILEILNSNNIKFFVKEREINEINKIDERLKQNIQLENNFFSIEKDEKMSLIFIEKKFETFDGIVTNLYSVSSKNEIQDKELKCKNLINIKGNQNIINKEYNLKDLNKELKNNLVSINDYVKFSSDNKFIYVVLCNIKFNKEILNNIKLKKLINSNVKIIEKNFIKKYSQLYNLFENDA